MADGHHFWAAVSKTVCPMLSDHCLSVLSCLCVTFVHCGQTLGRIKMKLGTQVDLRPGHIVLDGDPTLPSPKRGQSPLPSFWPISVVAKRLHASRSTWYRCRPQPCPGDFVLDGDPAPKFSAHVYCSYCDFVRTLHNAQSLLVCSSSSFSILCILFLEKKFNHT